MISLKSPPFASLTSRWLAIFLFAIYPAIVFAVGDVTPLQTGSLEAAANAANDPAMSAMGWANRLFGDLVLNPMAMVGQPDGALSDILIMVNLSLMLMGTLWVTYTIVSAGAMTAQEGAFIGRNMHSAWVPFRLVVGVASLTPFFKGLCFAQILMLWAIQLSIGAGNLSYQKGLEYVTKHNTLLAPSHPATDASTELVNALFLSNICAHGLNAGKMLMYPDGDYPVNEFIKTPPRVGDDPVSHKKVVSFESGMRGFTFNLKQCGSYQVSNDQLGAFLRMNTALNTVANEVVTDTTKVIVHAEGMDTLPKFDPSILMDIKKAYLADLQTAAKKVVDSTITGETYRSEMLAQAQQQADSAGFVTAGAWAYTLAAKNSAMHARISDAPKILKAPIAINDPSIEAYNNVYSYAANLTGSAIAASGQGGETGDGESFVVNKVKEKWCNGTQPNRNANVLPNIGECVASWMINDDDQQNVLVRIANVGDWLVWAGMGGEVAARIAERELTAVSEDNIVAKATKLLGGGVVASFATGAADAAIELLGFIAKTLLMFGLVASTYIPLVPAVVWVYRMVAMCAVWFEGVVGASVWAFSHLDTEGDGLGQRARHGYLFVFAVLLNPMLMVLGLFAGIAILDVVGGYFMKIYPTMIADVSQDNMVGLLKIGAFLVVFVMISLGLVNACSQLINVIPDQVIAWAGGQFQNTLGRNGVDEVAGKVSHALNAGALGNMGKDIAAIRAKIADGKLNSPGVTLSPKT